jgi:hypothetical protein
VRYPFCGATPAADAESSLARPYNHSSFVALGKPPAGRGFEGLA